MTRDPLRPVYWVGSSLRDLRTCPPEVQDVVGYAPFLAQGGGRHPAAKRLKADLQGLIEVVEDHASGTYRAVYTPDLPQAVYVLHVYQKKATHRIAMPKHVRELIKARLRWAEQHARSQGVE